MKYQVAIPFFVAKILAKFLTVFGRRAIPCFVEWRNDIPSFPSKIGFSYTIYFC